jgi:hypothetical protein
MAMAGCSASHKKIATPEPIGMQLRRLDPQSRWTRYDVLLSFESESDRAFVVGDPAAGMVDARIAHAGQCGLFLPGGMRQIDIKLSSLLRGRKDIGEWTLAGAFVFADQPLIIHAAYWSGGKSWGGRAVPIPARQWTALFVDLTGVDRDVPAGVLRLRPEGSAAIHLDDVTLVDNRRVLVDSTTDGSGLEGWRIIRRGFAIDGDAPGRFRFALETPESAPNGWVVQQVNALRALFVSEDKTKTLCIYPDGRAYWDGNYRPMGSMERYGQAIAQQHDDPAEVQVLDEGGKLNRSTRGDANHDGYNECLGAYQLTAAGWRLQVRMTPRTARLVLPVLEIAGLPDGKVQVTVEGRLVDQWERLEDGSVLVVIPARLQRSTLIDIRVKGVD